MPRHVHLSMNDWSDTEVRIDYSPREVPVDNEHEYYMPAQEMIFGHQKKSAEWIANIYTFANRNIYSVEDIKKDKKPLIKNRKFAFDIFEAIFFHLTRFEEYHADLSLKDEWDMMHEKHHFLVKNKIQEIPVVDHLVESFLLSIGLVPETFDSTLTITHDIDVLQKFDTNKKVIKAIVGDILRNKSIISSLKMYRLYKEVKRGKTHDPYNTFHDLFSTSDHRKIVYFMAGGTSSNDEKYRIDNEEFKEISLLALERGYQIGLHPSYNSYDDYTMITEERQKLQEATGKKIRTSRQHFLRFAFDETITALSDSGIYEDSSLGYQRMIGFRCGTAFTYLLYDLRRDRVSRVSETPMIIMDGALLEQMDHDALKAMKKLNQFIDTHLHNSHLTINFHNTIFDPTRYNIDTMWRMYHMIIDKYSK